MRPNFVLRGHPDAWGAATASILFGLLSIFPGHLGCVTDGCCNDCTRNYRLDESSGLGSVTLPSGKSANECEIGDEPYKFEPGEYWVLATIEEQSSKSANGETYYQYRLESISLRDPSSRPSGCEDPTSFGSPEDLVSEEVEEGTDVCVRGRLVAEAACTQKGCPTI